MNWSGKATSANLFIYFHHTLPTPPPPYHYVFLYKTQIVWKIPVQNAFLLTKAEKV